MNPLAVIIIGVIIGVIIIVEGVLGSGDIGITLGEVFEFDYD